MIYTLVCDPGKKHPGWSAWAVTELVACGLARVPKGRHTLGQRALLIADQLPSGADVCVVERMFHYPSHGRRDSRHAADAKANDLLDLQAIGGIIAGRSGAGEIVYYTARDWKGQRPKEATKHLVEKTLTPQERLVYGQALAQVASGLRHNVIDAVGIGLRHLRRTPR